MAPLTLFTWLLLVWACGWLGWPLLRGLTAGTSPPQTITANGTYREELLGDAGVALARVLFLALWTLAAWGAGQLGLATRWTSLLWLPLALMGVGLAWKSRVELAARLRGHRRGILRTEAVFFAVFLLFFLLRGFWSDTSGTNGEKAMDMALIGAIGRAEQLPPPNPYAAGVSLRSYYYFGHLQTALITGATGSEVRWTYNLMAATLPALCFSTLFSLAVGVSGRFASGLGLTLGILLLGTLQPLVQLWRIATQPSGSGAELLNSFATSRVIPFTINEYPWFTFNQADLHAHYFSFPLQLALLAVAWCIYSGAWRGILLAVPLLAALILTNTWDFPAYCLLLLLVVLWPRTGNGPLTEPATQPATQPAASRTAGLPRLPGWSRLALALAVLVLPIVVASPFILGLKSAATPPQLLAQPASPLGPWLLLWGPFALLWGGGLYYLSSSRTRDHLLIVGTSALVLTLVLRLATGQNYGVLITILGMLGATLLCFSAGAQLGPIARFWLLPGLCGLLALLWAETTWAGFLGNRKLPRIDEYIRQDTVFKFGLQTWMLWGSAALGIFIAGYNRWPRAIRLLWIVPVPVMLLSSWITTSGRARQFSTWESWDAWAHLAPAEKSAAAWLKSHTTPDESVVEAVHPRGGDYTEFTRFTAATGIPTILGPRAHTFQWAPAQSGVAGEEWDETARRRDAVQLIYGKLDPATRKKLLDLYKVRYVIVGRLERETYGPVVWPNALDSLPVAFQSGHTDDPNRVLVLLNNG